MIGQTLAHYRILESIGRGGMGEVYLAEDARLGRQVALKILPPGVAESEELRTRFEREARALAALNHPGIVTIHSVEETGAVHFITMELVKGRTLAERLRDGPLPCPAFFDVAIPLAEAVAAAHEEGVVHRDLKPGNVMLTGDGRVKVLDFGLAHTGSLVQTPGDSESPTELRTREGVIAGTLHYMAPEQAEGKAPDHRVDIFALGVVFYEMLCGTRPFEGASPASTISSILKDEPRPLDDLGAGVPPQLERVIRRCLEKQPAKRFQSARDLAFALESLSLAPTSAGEPPSQGVSRRRALVASFLGLAALGSAFVLGRATGSSAPEPVSYERLTFRRGAVGTARFDPAGRNVVYSAAWEGDSPQLFSTRPGSRMSRPLGLAGAGVFGVSPVGDIALIQRERGSSVFPSPGTLGTSSLAGGSFREVREHVLLADLAADGETMAVVVSEDGRQRVEYPVGTVLYETANLVEGLRISPDGRLLALGHKPRGFSSPWQITFLTRDGTPRTYSAEARGDHLDLAWSPDGREVWFNTVLGGSLDLYALSTEGRRRVLASPPVLLRIVDVSREGLALVARTAIRFEVWGVAPGDARERNYSWLDMTEVDAISRDGSTLLLTEFGEGGGDQTWSVYLRSADRSPAVRIGEGQAHDLSPDGRWALTQRLGASPSLVLLPTGAGDPVEVENDRFVDFLTASFAPDGDHVLFAAEEPGSLPRFYLQPLGGGEPRPITPGLASRHIDPGSLLGQRPLSPDGRFVASFGDDDRLVLYPVDGGSPRPIDGTEPGWWVVGWSPDGRTLYVREEGATSVRLYRVEPDTGRRELWKTVTPTDPAGFEEVYAVHVADDGVSYYYTIYRILSDLYLATGLR